MSDLWFVEFEGGLARVIPGYMMPPINRGAKHFWYDGYLSACKLREQEK